MTTARSLLVLVALLLLTVGGGLLIGVSNPPGDWYAGLAKPAWTPPNWLFPVSWTLLYVLVAVAGWLVFRGGPRTAQVLWVGQVAVNFAWSPSFFGAQRIGLGLAVVATLLVLILLFIVATWRTQRTATLLFLPYAAWVAYATALNHSIWRLN